MVHIPVLLKETIEILNPRPGKFFIDGTVDGGGHAKEILARISPGGIFLGVDWDERMIEKAKENFGAGEDLKIFLINDNYANIPEILKNEKLGLADCLLLDLGFSSEQINFSGRGFSFNPAMGGEPLLMTYSKKTKPAYKQLEELKVSKLAEIIKNFGEEKFAGRIAAAIKKNLPIKTSGKLAEVVRNALPKKYEHGRINPATRTFLALRIFVNQEFENLKRALAVMPQIVKSGGRATIISFNSLEDKIVKNGFKELAKEKKAALLTKKPIKPSDEEIKTNPKSRSAKLRAIQII